MPSSGVLTAKREPVKFMLVLIAAYSLRAALNLSKIAYTTRIRLAVRSKASQTKAQSIAKGLWKTCRIVLSRNGAASGR